MRLLKVRFHNFRRFAGTCSLDLDELIVALVGPNEAGKSSVLDGIEKLLARQAPEDSDVTRGIAGRAKISGLFLLDPDDRAALSGIHEGHLVERVWISRESGSPETTWEPEPFPTRDRSARQRTVGLLEGLSGDPALDAANSRNQEAPWDPQMRIDVLEQLRSDPESFPDGVIVSFETLAERIRDLDVPVPDRGDEAGAENEESAEAMDEHRRRNEAREATASALVDLAALERLPEPWEQVADELEDRQPSVAFFRQRDRELTTTYVLAEIVGDPPPALVNLCTVAGLNIDELNAQWETNKPHVEKLIEDANAYIKKRFQMTWNQSTVYPRFGAPSDGILRLYISTEGDADYSEVQERSDGLRWFLALDAFLAARGSQLPVLLVDEAETHLHYDAQADLVDALMRQHLTAKVVYTTHSIGCLPPDLGRGIRAVLPERDVERSRIENSYWSITPDGATKLGYTPLLFAMGASLLSLTVPQYGLICEGPSEAILLPTLLREVAELSTLPYRVVPGLSEIARSEMEALSHHAGRVACLTDGDAAGLELLEQIEAAGVINEDCLFNLSRILDGCTLEDLIDSSVFARAVNIELETWGLTKARLTSADIPDTGRSTALKAWCEANGADAGSLNKNRIAQRVVDLRSTGDDGSDPMRVVAADAVVGLKALHDQISAALGVDSD